MEKHNFLDMSLSKVCPQCGDTFYRDNRNARKNWEKTKFCGRKCAALHGSKVMRKRLGNPMDRIKANSEINPETGCWIWTGASNNRYGVIGFEMKQYYAHRLSLSQKLGREIKDGMFACRTCDTPLCVNPDHLYEGTPAQNSLDACNAGNHAKKLTAEKALEIRNSKRTTQELAERYGVTDAMILAIKNGKKWRHV